jgi:peroxiredoxin
MRLLFTALVCLISFGVFGQNLEIGNQAPDIIMENPNGEVYTLSDLRGKVVLIHFWASWSRRSRKENVNVVKAYDKYSKTKFKNADGFEIFSVSLDKTISSWKLAITQDNLSWDYHVSDLKKWENEAADKYGVYSILSNFLLNENGIIVAKNLKGDDLLSIDTLINEFVEKKTVINPDNSLSTKASKPDNIRIRVSDLYSEISKVAVIGKESTLCDGTKDDGQGLAELVEGELLGLYGVVERRHLEEILDEQRLAMSGMVLEDTDFANAGCLAGAQGTVLVSYGCLQDRTKLQVKLVDCSTSEIHWSATGFDVSEFDLLDALRSKLK